MYSSFNKEMSVFFCGEPLLPSIGQALDISTGVLKPSPSLPTAGASDRALSIRRFVPTMRRGGPSGVLLGVIPTR